MTSMVICLVFGNWSICVIIKLFYFSVNGIIWVISVEEERYKLKNIVQVLISPVGGIKMTFLYYLVRQSKFSTFVITNWVDIGKLCNAFNLGECLMYQR